MGTSIKQITSNVDDDTTDIIGIRESADQNFGDLPRVSEFKDSRDS